jgi:hypothetical protein
MRPLIVACVLALVLVAAATPSQAKMPMSCQAALDLAYAGQPSWGFLVACAFELAQGWEDWEDWEEYWGDEWPD